MTLLGERHHVLLSIALVLNVMVLVLVGVNRIEQEHEHEKAKFVIESITPIVCLDGITEPMTPSKGVDFAKVCCLAPNEIAYGLGKCHFLTPSLSQQKEPSRKQNGYRLR